MRVVLDECLHGVKVHYLIRFVETDMIVIRDIHPKSNVDEISRRERREEERKRNIKAINA